MADCHGVWWKLLAHGVVAGLVAPLALVIAAVVGPGVPTALAAEPPAFDTGDLDEAPRVVQPRDVASVSPARLLETRSAPGLTTIDGQFEGIGTLAAGQTVSLQVAGRGGVPDVGATAVVLNVTAVLPAANGFITAYPCGQPRPLAANLNYQPGENRPNAVLAKIGVGGTVCLYAKSPVDLVVDVNGYVGEESSTKAVNPARLLETRSGAGFETIDGQFEGIGARAAGSTVELVVTGRGGIPSAGVEAVMLNVAAVAPRDLGFITAYPCGQPRPLAANLNYRPGETRPNAVLAKVGVGGKVCLFTRSAVDLVVDVNGYIGTDDAATAGTPLSPARLLETRSAPGLDTIDGDYLAVGAVAAGTTLELQVTGRGGVPNEGVGAAMLNVAAVNPRDVGFITVYPCGVDRPLAANLNYRPGQTVPNAVLARIGNGGKVCLFTRSTVDLVVDVNGYFGLAPNQPDSNVNVLDEAEIVSVSFAPSAAFITSADALVPDPETATITTSGDEALDVGDIVVLEKDDGTPYYGRVEERQDADTVRAEQVPLADVVPSMDVSIEVDTATKETIKKEGATDVGDVEVGDDEPLTDEQKKQKPTCGATLTAQMEIDTDVRAGRFVFDMSFNKTLTGLRSARIGYAPEVDATVAFTLGGGFNCSISKDLFTKKLPSIRFAVGPVPVVITQEITVGINGSLSGDVTTSRVYEIGADAFVGMIYEDGSWDRETSMELTVDESNRASVDFNFQLDVPAITYSARAYGIVGFDATLAASLRLTYSPPLLSDTTLKLTASVDVSASIVIELDFKVVTFQWSFDFLRITILGPKELWANRAPSTDCASVTQIPTDECEALIALYNEVNGPSWINPGLWGTNDEPCGGPGLDAWVGVTCSGGHVTELRLPNRNLAGALPSQIGDLGELVALDLRGAALDSVPTEIGDLSKLQELVLASTGLTFVPSGIGQLTSLQELYLSSNSLVSLPAAMFGLTNLTALDLTNNDLTSVPHTIDQLTKLEYLALERNEIPGLPSTVWNMSSLQFLGLNGNPIGDLPAGVGNLTNLTGLFASSIGMSTVPDEIGNLRKLDFLKLDDNSISELPDSLAGLAFIEQLYISFNEFVELPPEIATYGTLTNLYMSGNPWNDDGTAVMSAVRANNPALVVVRVGNDGCVAITDSVVRSWLANFDFQYVPTTSCPL